MTERILVPTPWSQSFLPPGSAASPASPVRALQVGLDAAWHPPRSSVRGRGGGALSSQRPETVLSPAHAPYASGDSTRLQRSSTNVHRVTEPGQKWKRPRRRAVQPMKASPRLVFPTRVP